MKKNIFKTLLCVLLCVSMLGAVIMTSACNPTSVPSGQISSDADPSDRDSGENGSNENVQLVDRSDYTADKAAQIISASKVTDIVDSFIGEKDSPLKDFMIGDFINMIVEKATESLIGGGNDDMIGEIDLGESDIDGLIGSIGGLLPFDLPNGTNLSVFAYGYYSDGYWRSGLNNAKAHKILNIILCYKPFGAEPIEFSEQDIKTYGNATVIEILGYKNNELIAPVLYSNKIVGAMMDATVGEINALFSKDEEKIFSSVIDICGDLTVSDLAETFGVDLGAEFEAYSAISVADIVGEIEKIAETGVTAYVLEKVAQLTGALLVEYGDTVIVDDITVADLIAAIIGEQEKGVEADYVSAMLELFGDVKLSAIAEKFGGKIEDTDEDITVSELYELFAAMSEEPAEGEVEEPSELTIEELLAYVSENYGEIVIVDDITVDDLITAIGEAYAEEADILAVVYEMIGDYSIGDIAAYQGYEIPKEFLFAAGTRISDFIDEFAEIGEIGLSNFIINVTISETVSTLLDLIDIYGDVVIVPEVVENETVVSEAVTVGIVLNDIVDKILEMYEVGPDTYFYGILADIMEEYGDTVVCGEGDEAVTVSKLISMMMINDFDGLNAVLEALEKEIEGYTVAEFVEKYGIDESLIPVDEKIADKKIRELIEEDYFKNLFDEYFDGVTVEELINAYSDPEYLKSVLSDLIAVLDQLEASSYERVK